MPSSRGGSEGPSAAPSQASLTEQGCAGRAGARTTSITQHEIFSDAPEDCRSVRASSVRNITLRGASGFSLEHLWSAGQTISPEPTVCQGAKCARVHVTEVVEWALRSWVRYSFVL